MIVGAHLTILRYTSPNCVSDISSHSGLAFAAELGREEAGVESVLRQQSGVRADAPAMQHQEQISRQDGAQAVCDDDAGPARHAGLQRPLNQAA